MTKLVGLVFGLDCMIRSGPNARIEYGLSLPLQWMAKQTGQRSVA